MRFVAKKIQHDSWPDFFSTALNDLRDKGLYRQLRVVDPPISTHVSIGDSSYIIFCSNDYLGLANDSRLKKVATEAIKSWGTGSGASRFISGNISLYKDLEADAARYKRTEAALVFSCGYTTNVGVISSLVDKGDLILSDALNHASIVDACRLSKAKIQVYPHVDYRYIENFLAGEPEAGKVLIVTDGVFSMTGDLAPLPELHRICLKHGALLMVDDAHGTGVIGPEGRGSLDYFGMEQSDIVQVGTFSKALGSLGGFVAGSTLLIDFITNHARPLMYSTALPPSVLASNREGLRIVLEDSSRRERLSELRRYLEAGLERLGLPVSSGASPIVPLVIGDVEETLSLAQHLLEKRIFVPAIRPPTVPDGSSRLRISLSSLHTETDLDRLFLALDGYYKMGS